MLRNCGCLRPEFVETSQLVEENKLVTLSVGLLTLIKMNGMIVWKSWTPIGLLFNVLRGNRKWSEWEMSEHECSAHEKNALVANFTYDFRISANLRTTHSSAHRQCLRCKTCWDIGRGGGTDSLNLFCNWLDAGLCKNMRLHRHIVQHRRSNSYHRKYTCLLVEGSRWVKTW